MIISARRVALQAVLGTLRNGVSLDLGSSALKLDSRDRALAFEIASGTLRHLATLDYLLKTCMPRPPSTNHFFLWAVLRTALYQVIYMRVPDRAAVYEAVEIIKNSRDKERASFVNAVLRKAISLDRKALIGVIVDPLEKLAVSSSHPVWLLREWWQSVGEESTRNRAYKGNQPAPLTLRANLLATTRSKLLEIFGESAQPCLYSPDGVVLSRASGAIEKIPGYANGWFVVQDQAAQLVSHWLNPQVGDRILDACSAPGGKASHLAALTQNGITLTLVEKDPERVVLMRANFKRLRVKGVEIRVGDAADATLLADRRFDRVLVDAPCTGTGVIRRHPEIKWRRSLQDVSKLANIQRRILNTVAERVVDGGVLIYATCSLQPRENQQQIKRFLSEHPEWQRKPIDADIERVPKESLTPEGDVQLEPGMEDMDGFYVARLQKQS